MEVSLQILQDLVNHFNEHLAKDKGYYLTATISTNTAAVLVFTMTLKNSNTSQEVSAAHFMDHSCNVKQYIMESIDTLATTLGMW